LGASIAGLSAASGLLDDPAFAETAKGLEDLLLRHQAGLEPALMRSSALSPWCSRSQGPPRARQVMVFMVISF